MSRDNPFQEIEEVLDRMGVDIGMESPFGGSIAVDVRDEGDAFVVTADVPGVEKDDVTVTVSGQTVGIEADYDSETEVESDDWIRRERRQGSVSRSVSLPEPIDEEAVEATHNAGVLTITLPKHDPEGGTEIEVE